MTGKDTQQDAQQQDTTKSKQPVQKLNPTQQTIKNAQGEDIPFFPAPRSHASDSVTRLARRASEMSRSTEDPGIPDSATPQAKLNTRMVLLPAGGIAALADSLWPEDANNPDAMDQHHFDLMHLNNDLLRDDTASTVGQMVRIPV